MSNQFIHCLRGYVRSITLTTVGNKLDESSVTNIVRSLGSRDSLISNIERTKKLFLFSVSLILTLGLITIKSSINSCFNLHRKISTLKSLV